MCIDTDNACNQEAFQISFPQFVWEAKYETMWTQLVEKYVILNIFSVKKHTALLSSNFPNVTFPSMLQMFLIFFGTGFEVLKVVRIHNRSVLGNCIVCYMVINVFGEYSGCIFAGCRETDAICADWNLGTHQSDYSSITQKNVGFNSNMLHFPCIVSLPYLLQTIWIHVLGNKYTLLFGIIYCSVNKCQRKRSVIYEGMVPKVSLIGL